MDFLSNLSQYGEAASKRISSRHKDPVMRMRANFDSNVKQQIKYLESGRTPKRAWFTVKNGKYHVTLRNGNKLIDLPGGQTLVIDNQAKAVMFYSDARDACMDGDLDQLLIDSQKQRKQATN